MRGSKGCAASPRWGLVTVQAVSRGPGSRYKLLGLAKRRKRVSSVDWDL